MPCTGHVGLTAGFPDLASSAGFALPAEHTERASAAASRSPFKDVSKRKETPKQTHQVHEGRVNRGVTTPGLCESLTPRR